MADADFESVVERFYKSLYCFALSLARNEPEAWDLTQQTFTIWARKSHQLRDPAKAKSWLFRTLHREFLGNRRRGGRAEELDLDASHAELPAIPSAVMAEMDGRTVLAALHRLEEIFRAPLALFYLEGHSYREIAEILEIPAGTVMSRLARGKQALREHLLTASAATEGKTIPFPDGQGGPIHG